MGGAMDHINERNLMRCGEYAVITAYRNCKDIDVRFDSGETREHMAYSQFKSGRISKTPRYGVPKHVGERKIMRSGIEAEVTAWLGKGYVDVRFSDGTVKKHVSYSNFSNGGLMSPNQSVVKWGAGSRKQALNGLWMEVVERLPDARLRIRFENGEERIVTLTSFLDGHVASLEEDRKRRYERVVVNFQGLNMRVKDYRKSDDVDVIFDDGTVITHCDHSLFLYGKVRNPNWNACVGKTFIARNGLSFVPIRCLGTNEKVECVFEDGAHAIARAGEVREGVVRHPELTPRGKSHYLGYDTMFAYREDDKAFYMVVDQKTRKRGVMTPQMMMENRKKVRVI